MKKDFSHNERFAELYKNWASENNITINQEALNKFNSTPFPTLKDEDWRFTNVAPILKQDFSPTKINDTKISIDDYAFFEDSIKIVINNGFYDKTNSKIGELPEGVIIKGFANAINGNIEIISEYLNGEKTNENAFELLNKLFATDGVFIQIKDNVILERPVEVFFVSSADDKPLMISPRNFIVLGKNSEAKIIFRNINLSGNFFFNYCNNVLAGENSNLQFYEFRTEPTDAYFIGSTYNDIKNSAVYNHYTFDLNGRLIRNNFRVDLNGENIECHLYGFYVGQEKRHVDNHTYIAHNKPNCFSNEIYKGILDNEAKAVFGGRIYVAKDSQKTNAYQSNKTVLLSDKARIDTKPQLEIYADDVKCTHGATVGQLDEEMLFYIISRGIPKDKARSMLISAFAADIIEGVKIQDLKEKINEMILNVLDK